MGGSAHLCDKGLLTNNSPCILSVREGDASRTIWWGEITKLVDHGTHIEVWAKITGGRMAFDERGKPIMSDEQQNIVPDNYEVYPDTPSFQHLFRCLLEAWRILQESSGQTEHWRQTHFDFLADLVGRGLAPRSTLDLKTGS
ncbi:MAG: hypothetical protein UW63_C0018G0014 [Candidatus Uhrbacteria bacterium GW2011_GWF2_44_350]|uniref:Uncharacterized protein n=1 Tax=Candidatus Uhrbacteria bacterium GW2011_GWF2_44_350 TaxID=1619000 RepID=A0A0G1MHB0_9BACT|nr:MAG: hypothetical protein UW63_C0018G0014 [Candidatus Uhrbacteria bacterium GW2011_GWF2_44_350]